MTAEYVTSKQHIPQGSARNTTILK